LRRAKYLKTGKFTLYKMAREGKNIFVKIELRRNRKVIVKFPYEKEAIEKVKTIPGRRWIPEKKTLGNPL